MEAKYWIIDPKKVPVKEDTKDETLGAEFTAEMTIEPTPRPHEEAQGGILTLNDTAIPIIYN